MKSRIALAFVFAASLAACSTSLFAPQVLRVGFTPDKPSLIFMKDGLPAGVEVDLANELGYALKRPVEFIPLRQNAQFATLVVNQVDILMTGLVMPTNATPNVVFTPPYSTNGPLVWAIRSADKDLRLDISKHLAIWYADGTINRILKKWNLPPTAPTQMIVVPKHVSTNALPNAMELQPVNDRRTR